MPVRFGYASGIWDRIRANYTIDDWFGLIQTEISAYRPVLYGILLNSESKHAILCDGWRITTAPEVHFNFGWANEYDAWYTLDPIAESYDPQQEVMIGNIMPAPSGTECLEYEDYSYGAPVVTSVVLPDSSGHEGSQQHTAIVVSENDGLAFVTLSETGMQIVDLATAEAPTLRGYVAQPGIYWEDVAYPFLYCSGSGGLRIYDVSDPDTPTLANVIPIASQEVKVSGNLLLVCSSAGLQIYDRSDPDHPELLSTLFGVSGYVMAVAGGHAFIVYGNALHVIEINEPVAPAVVGTLYLPYSPECMVIGDGYAYLGKVEMGYPVIGEISIVDIADPTNPTLVSVCQTPVTEMKYRMVYDRRRLYFAGTSSLYVLEVSDPQSPHVIGRTKAMGTYAIALNGGYIYGVDSWHWPSVLRVMWPQCSEAPSELPSSDGSISSFELRCRPNPLNPRTTISFELARAQAVSLRVYDIAGRLVTTLLDDWAAVTGRNEIVWDSRDNGERSVSAGVYFYRLTAGKRSETGRMVIIK